ncbi:MAG: HAD family hydrolase [Erysipelothrix sp.]|nr:HAD family hydrolase [Erysipelothrix sp.]
MTYPIVFFDVDGTLLNSSKKVTPLTRFTLELLKEQDIKLCIATGRPIKSARLAMKLHGIDHLISGYVCNNGTDTLNLVSKVHNQNHLLSRSDAIKILNHVKSLNLNAMIYGQEHLYAFKMDDTVDRISDQNQLEPVITDIFNLEFETTPKVLFIVNEETSAQIHEFMAKNPLKGYQSFISQSDLYEFVNDKAGKGKGVVALASEFGFEAKDIMAYGDAENDHEMIQLVGHGVAMSNGDEILKSIAQEVCASNDEDGVAFSLIHHYHLSI